MNDAVRWVGGILVFMGVIGLALIFIGTSYTNLDSNSIALLEGLDPNLYVATFEFVTVGGIFLVVLSFLGVAKGMAEALREMWESF